MSETSGTPGASPSPTPQQQPTPLTDDSGRSESLEVPADHIIHFNSGPLGESQWAAKNRKPGDTWTKSVFTGPLHITFSDNAELVRAQSNARPEAVFRTFYENSATLTPYVTKDCLVKHRDVPHLKLEEGNAFQAIADFFATRDLVPERIERHFVTQQKVEPSAFISAYSKYNPAKGKADKQYNQSRLVGHRVAIAKINLDDLVPARIKGPMQTTSVEYVKSSLTIVDRNVVNRHVSIPVWVDKTLRPDDMSSITIQQFHDSGAEMWMSRAELRMSNLNICGSTKQDAEWLACGRISTSRIVRVMPFDGDTVHKAKGSEFVQSLGSIEKYIYDWSVNRWRHNPDTSDFRPFRNATPQEFAGSGLDDSSDSSDNDDDSEDGAPRPKRARRGSAPQVLAMSAITSIESVPKPRRKFRAAHISRD